MARELPATERQYLRELAQKQTDLARLPVMDERKQMWFDLNDGVPEARPPVIIETQTFDRDFMPKEVFQCETDTGRGIESQLLRNVRNHEYIDDDKVMPDTFDIGWFIQIDEFGVKIPREYRDDAQGVRTGYRFIHPVKDIERDMEQLKPATCTIDREGTLAYKDFLEDLLGDILPVEIRGRLSSGPFLTNRVVELMGMEAFFFAMMDKPDKVHELMAYLRDNALRVMRWSESEELLTLNNRNQVSFGSSYNFTHRLPDRDLNGGPVRLTDMWGSANTQESIGLSPEMFHEFCFPYYREAVEPYGLLYFGCCEPADLFWDDLKQLPHLKKISVPRWSNERFIGEALQGTDIILSRKPDPNFLAVDETLNEEGWAAGIRDTLKAAKGVAVEFIIRDVYTVQGDLRNAHRAVELARNEIDQFGF